VPPYEPRPDLTTERVSGGRLKALAVLAVAAVIVGGLIWKPWDRPSTPTPTPTPGLVGVAHPSPSPIPTPTVLVIPDDPGVIGPQPPPTTGGPAATDEPSPTDTGGALGAVSLDNGADGYVQCTYKTTVNPPPLIEVRVNPPVITTGEGAATGVLRAVSWTAVLETNQLSAIFEADWQPIDVSATHVFVLHGRRTVTFKPVTFDVKSLSVGTSDVLRVTVLVNWIGAHGARLSQMSVLASSYAAADSPTDIIPEGCATTRVTAHF